MKIVDQYIAAKIIPVAVVDNENELRNLADLCSQYVPAIELTMRTKYAMTALKILKKDYPQLATAAATILSTELADEVLSTGTELLISPGFTPKLVEYCAKKGYEYIPGVSTPAELEFCLSYGFKVIKFFPAEVAGGIKWLKAMESVYQHTKVQFMPLGGVSLENVSDYLKLDNVAACGGSWICPKNLIIANEWKEIENRFQEVCKLLKEV